MTGATPHATTATRGTAVTIPLRGAAASRAGRHTLCHVLEPIHQSWGRLLKPCRPAGVPFGLMAVFPQ